MSPTTTSFPKRPIQRMARSLTSGALGLAAAAALLSGASAQEFDKGSPGGSVVDEFHPDRGDGKAPLFGGRVIVHLATLPKHANYVTENTVYTRDFLYECHAMLLLQDWWSPDHEYIPEACSGYVTEDLVVLHADAPSVAGERRCEVVRRDGGAGRRSVRAVYGAAAQNADGSWTVTPASRGSELEDAVTLPAASVERLERGAVMTFELREGARWQNSVVYQGEGTEKVRGQTLDAQDVHFSWSVYSNPGVNCDEKRFQFEKFPTCEIVDPLTVRFFCEKQDVFSLNQLATSMTLLASHIYNLDDPDCPDHDPNASASKKAQHINDNPHNKLWVGLGPYQITAWQSDFVEATRFVDDEGAPAYFNLDNAGYVDTIRWRHISNDEQAMLALLNEEVDFFYRVKSEDYFEGRTLDDEFKERFYKGFFYAPYFGITAWNLYKPALKDPAVRTAIAHAFDFKQYLVDQYNGLGYQVTGPIPYFSPFYDHSIEPLEYDPDLALEILEDAGWYDRDGDDIADKDGVALELEFLFPAGNDASKLYGRRLQDSLKPLGIKVNLESMEGATFFQRIKEREFTSCNLAWAPELESDPEQLWHSKWGEFDRESSNLCGLMDPEVDALIHAIQAEVDRDKRKALWHEFHAKIYSIQPYMFSFTVPKKYAANKRLRGIRHSAISPSYVIRDWYFVDPAIPGTRATLAAGGDPK